MTIFFWGGVGGGGWWWLVPYDTMAQVLAGELSDGSGANGTASDAQLTARRNGKPFQPTASDDRESLCRAAYASRFELSVSREAGIALQFWDTERRDSRRMYAQCEKLAKASIDGLSTALTMLA
jgi:hypothetical protein